MGASRRTFLGMAGTLLALAGCGAMPQLPVLPGGSGPRRQTLVGAFSSGSMSGVPDDQLSLRLQRGVDQLVQQGTIPVQPHLVPIPIGLAPADPADQSTIPATVQALAALMGNGTSGAATTLMPDLVAFSSRVAVEQAVAQRLLRPIDDLLHTTGVAHQGDYFPGALEAGVVSGKTYGLPLTILPGLLQYDAQLLSDAGLPPPDGTWDWSRLLDASHKLTKPPGQYAFAPAGLPDIEVLLWQNGAQVVSKDGRQSALEDPAAIEAVAFWGDLFQRYRVVAPGAVGSPMPVGSFDLNRMTYQGAQIAFQFLGGFAGMAPTTQRRFRLAEPFRGTQQVTTLDLQGLLTITSRAADPGQAFGVMVALAEAIQQSTYLPPRRSLAEHADPFQYGDNLDATEAAAVRGAAAYARVSTLTPALREVLHATLEQPLQAGSLTAAQACKAATTAINRLLQVGTEQPRR